MLNDAQYNSTQHMDTYYDDTHHIKIFIVVLKIIPKCYSTQETFYVLSVIYLEVLKRWVIYKCTTLKSYGLPTLP